MPSPSVLDRLRRLFMRRTAERDARENPLFKAAVSKASLIYAETPLGGLIDQETSGALARDLYLELNEVCNAFDPRSVCREKLARAMLRFASLQVVAIPPPPTADESGLRGLPGITGELRPRLDRLILADTDLRTELDAPADDESTWSALQKSYWETYWYLQTFNATRLELGDSTGDADWFRPFMHAACVNQEHLFRCKLDLPAAFDEDIAQVVVTAFSVYTDVVVSGAEDPEREWQAYCVELGVPTVGEGDHDARR